MFESRDLIDLHRRAQSNLAALIEGCRGLDADEFVREHEGFGYPSVHLQLHHVIGAERYWIGVLQGRIDADDDAPNHPDAASLETLRRNVADATEAYLAGASAAELNAPRAMALWGGRELTLAPVHVVLRVRTHAYHHQGQVTAMCRLMGKPLSGLDYPHAADF